MVASFLILWYLYTFCPIIINHLVGKALWFHMEWNFSYYSVENIANLGSGVAATNLGNGVAATNLGNSVATDLGNGVGNSVATNLGINVSTNLGINVATNLSNSVATNIGSNFLKLHSQFSMLVFLTELLDEIVCILLLLLESLF